MRIYYLDDEQALCNIFLEMIGITDHQCEVFSVVEEFLESCKSTPPDLVFIDYRLESTTGDLVASVMDETIPKILVTGELSVDSESLFDLVVPKPFKFRQILELVETYEDKMKALTKEEGGS